VERVFAGLAEGLSLRGHRVVRMHLEPTLEHEVTALGERWAVPLAEFRTWRKLPHPSSVLQSARAMAQLAGCLRRIRPGVVNVHFVDSHAAYFLLLRPVFGYRLVLSAHGSDVLLPRGPVHRALLPHLLRRADAVIAVSQDIATRVLSLAPAARLSLIRNGIDLAFWEADGEEVREPVRIVQVGTLREVKGQDVMLHALALLRPRLPLVELELVGEGTWRGKLSALAVELGIQDVVTFAGELDPPSIRERLQRATVCVLPSRSEGLPLSLLEAMAAGVPVVASAVGGVPEAAGDPPCALLVPPEDPGALAEALYTLLTDRARAQALSERARLRVREFGWPRVLDETEEVLKGPGPE
jgi:glycosyltransferase involved in cell wall biosynthesis